MSMSAGCKWSIEELAEMQLAIQEGMLVRENEVTVQVAKGYSRAKKKK